MSDCGRKISINDLIKYVSDNRNHMNDDVGLVSSDEDNEKVSRNQIIYPLKNGTRVKLTALHNNLDDIITKIDQNLFRMGVMTFIEELGEIDISLYSSVLWILKDGFSNYNKQRQSECVVEFLKTLIFCARSMFNDLNYKSLGWTEKQLVSDIKSRELGTTVARFLSDYLHVNIFILNMNDEQLYYTGSHPWVPYKKNILLVRHDNNTFEPVFAENAKFFGYESKLVSMLIMKPFVVKCTKCNFNFSTQSAVSFEEGSEDLHKYIVHDIILEEESDMRNKFDDNTDVSDLDDQSDSSINNIPPETTKVECSKKSDNESDSESDECNKEVSKYKTFKANELRDLAEKCGIQIKDKKTKKMKTKTDLVTELDKYYSK